MCTRVFIGRLSHRASERDVEDFFRGYGRIRDIVLKNGFGFVEFESSRDADDAIYDLNGKELGGERVTLEFSKRSRDNDRYDDGGRGFRGGRSFGGGGGRGPRPGDRYGPPVQTRHRLVVENLSTRISWQDLKDIMRKNGCDVTYADAHKREHEAIVLAPVPEDDVAAAEAIHAARADHDLNRVVRAIARVAAKAVARAAASLIAEASHAAEAIADRVKKMGTVVIVAPPAKNALVPQKRK